METEKFRTMLQQLHEAKPMDSIFLSMTKKKTIYTKTEHVLTSVIFVIDKLEFGVRVWPAMVT